MLHLAPPRSSRRARLVGLAVVGLGLMATPRISSAAEDGDPAVTRPPFAGRALYVSAGAGVVTDIAEPTSNLRILAAFPVSRFVALEPQVFAMRLRATSHHGTREDTSGAGLGFGVRYVPFPGWTIRPYASARLAHLHFWPDIWGDHTGAEAGVGGHASHHRFGLGGAIGADMPLAGAFRVGIEGDALALSGPGVNGFLQGMLTVGYGF